MASIVQDKPSIQWGNVAKAFNSLTWYDTFTNFIFRFMAKTSEPLLAAGVILSAIDFLQRGQLLAHNASLSLWWSIAQGVAMEVSVGPVLVNALDAREENDKTKAIFYAVLSSVLAVVGSAMLLMQFGLSVAGLTESQISPFVLWPLFVVRTVASIGYIALSCTKHKRFSGVSPQTVIQQTVIQQTHTAFEQAVSHIQAVHERSMQVFIEQVNTRLVQVEANTEHYLESVRSTLAQELQGVSHTLETRVTLDHLEGVHRAIAQDIETQIQTVQTQMRSELEGVRTTLSTLQEKTPASVSTETPRTHKHPRSVPRVVQSAEGSTEQRIRDLLTQDSTLSVRVLAQQANTSPSTADKWKRRIQNEQEVAQGGN